MNAYQRTHYARFHTWAGKRSQQRGITLFVIIIVVLLSTLLALWASRSALFNELLVGNDADYQRAYQAAQAMLQDAEFDIRGMRPDGSVCVADVSKPTVCRNAGVVRIPEESKELIGLFSQLDAQPTRCSAGICQKRAGAQDFWRDSATLTAMTQAGIGARYGQYTGALSGANGNPILAELGAGRGAWYWIEILPYADPNIALLGGNPSSNTAAFSPGKQTPWIYRITAIAMGLKPNTQVVLESVISLKTYE